MDELDRKEKREVFSLVVLHALLTSDNRIGIETTEGTLARINYAVACADALITRLEVTQQ